MLDFSGTTFRPKLMERNVAYFHQMAKGGKIDEELQKEIDAANAKTKEAQAALEKKMDENSG